MKNIDEGLNDTQKRQIIETAVTSACQVLMAAVVLTNAQNFITGDVIFPDGSKWSLKFEKNSDIK